MGTHALLTLNACLKSKNIFFRQAFILITATIGQQVGHGENKNEVAQAVGHFVLGATLAYINGGDPLSGGGAAVAAETAAQYLSRQYDDGQTARDPVTGEFNPNLLPESEKEEIRATTGAIASIWRGSNTICRNACWFDFASADESKKAGWEVQSWLQQSSAARQENLMA
ncbi:MAG: hypothetical protein Q4C79_05290 [Neisseria sp.]|uniref:hypothetical protein n=1 Tax=Neisseria sp. TaxID=192066 RepID=UPI0026DD7A00|nr:hypothetical protein [Neisseria sp.]MDO4248364.1 hypothetical protein [Neisseria sp.]